MEHLDPMGYDVAIVGGGPGGLSAALALGRARTRVLLLDAGEPRNARAHAMHNFVSRDGIAPAAFRREAQAQLAAYPNVVRAARRVAGIDGEAGAFTVRLAGGEAVSARRVVLALGMIDELPPLPGYAELWGRSLFQCPYCHGWEAQDQAWGFLAPDAEKLAFARFLAQWTGDLVAFTDGRFAVPEATRALLAEAGVAIEERAIAGLVATGEGEAARLAAVALADGTRLPRAVLFVRPPQRQAPLVEALGLALDPNGFVQVDARLQTSRPGVFAVGDMTSMMQSAMNAAATGQLAAAMVGHDLVFGPPPAVRTA